MSASGDRGGPVRFRPRALVLFALVGVLAVGAVVVRSPVPMLAAIPILLATVLSIWAAAQGPPQAELTWEALGLGSELEIHGTLRGSFGTSAHDIELGVGTPFGAVTSRPPRYERTPQEIRFSLTWALREPTIARFPAPTVVRTDPLGLVETPLAGSRPPLPVERYPPELHQLRSLRLDRTLELPGESRSNRIGSSGEFYGIRPAAPGESLRRINWRASARAGRLLANDFQLDRTGDLLLLLDVRPTPMGVEVDQRLLGIARAGVFGMADSFLRAKLRVGFAAFGEFLTAVPLSTGRGQRIRIQEAVLASRLDRVAGPPERCPFGLRRYFRPGLTTLVVSTCTGDPEFDLLPYLQRGGFPAVLVSPSPLSLAGYAAGTDELEETVARRLEAAQRRGRLAGLWAYGPVVDWTDYWSLGGLVRYMQRPAHRRVN